MALLKCVGLQVLLALATPTVAFATCTPGTFSGPAETCTGGDAQIVANVSADQVVTVQGNVTTGGIQLTAPGAQSISLTLASPSSGSSSDSSTSNGGTLTITPGAVVQTVLASPKGKGKKSPPPPPPPPSPPPPPPPPTITSSTGSAIELMSSGGNVSLTTGPGVTVKATSPDGDGIHLTTTGDGAISASIGGNVISANGIGIRAETLGDGPVTVTVAAGVNVSGFVGVLASGQGGLVTVNEYGSIGSPGNAPETVVGTAIDVFGGEGDVVINTSAGQFMHSINGIEGSTKFGSVVINSNATVISNGFGITAISPISTTVNVGGNVTAALVDYADPGYPPYEVGVEAIAGFDFGNSNATVNVVGASTNITSYLGVVVGAQHLSLTNNGHIFGTAMYGIYANAYSGFGVGLVSITNNASGIISGPGTTAGSDEAIEAVGDVITLNNSGLITTTHAGHAGFVIGVQSGQATVNNYASGTIDGLFDTAPSVIGSPGDARPTDTITLNNRGIWDTNGTSSFGSGSTTGSINNTGLVQVGMTSASVAPTASFLNGLSAFNNGSPTTTGTVSMVNGAVGDSLTIAAPFVGAAGHSVLYLDAYLGGPGSQADQLHLLNGSSGQTLVRIHNTGGPGATNASGVVLVTGVTSANNFALDPSGPGYDSSHGGITAGQYLYTLAFQNGSDLLIGAPNGKAKKHASNLTAGQAVFSQTSFTPDGGGIFQTAFSGFADRPRAWVSATNSLASDELQAQPQISALYRNQDEMAPSPTPSLRMSSVKSSGGWDVGYDQGFSSISAGVDLIRHSDEASAFSAGLGAAYVQSDQRFSGGASAMLYSGAVFGGYGAFRSGGWRLEGEVKSEVLKARYISGDPGEFQRPSASLTSSGASVTGGYDWRLAPGLSLQPVGSAAVQWTTMGALNVEGDQVRYEPSLRGWANAGLSMTDELHHGAYRLSASFTGLVWEAFGSENTAYLAGLGPQTPMVDRLNGVSGELRGVLDLAIGSGFSGYVQASARAGAHQEDFSALTGLRLRW